MNLSLVAERAEDVDAVDAIQIRAKNVRQRKSVLVASLYQYLTLE